MANEVRAGCDMFKKDDEDVQYSVCIARKSTEPCDEW